LDRIFRLSLFLLALSGCAHLHGNPYEDSTAAERAHFKRVPLPLMPGTQFKISQGAFGKNSHHDPGHEYTWDFDVPYGTPVVAVADGKVIQVYEPGKGGGCEARFNDYANNVKIEHRDGTVAQYTHVDPRVRVGDEVRRGELLALTSKNGFICTPQLDFAVFKDREHLFETGHPRNIPLLFEGLPENGMAREGLVGIVPEFSTK
jgi:murein DD-endopeptidase MepM/ murein hydrolase activator NlpD